jgi:hypothetical protein
MAIPSLAAARFATKIADLDAKWCAGCLRPLHAEPCDKRSAKMLESIKTIMKTNCPELNKVQTVWALHALDNTCTSEYVLGRLNSGQESGKKNKAKRVKISSDH